MSLSSCVILSSLLPSYIHPYPFKIGTINGERLSFQQKTNYNLNLSKCIFQWGLNNVLNNEQFTIRFRILQYFVLMWGGVVCWPIIQYIYIPIYLDEIQTFCIYSKFQMKTVGDCQLLQETSCMPMCLW